MQQNLTGYKSIATVQKLEVSNVVGHILVTAMENDDGMLVNPPRLLTVRVPDLDQWSIGDRLELSVRKIIH